MSVGEGFVSNKQTHSLLFCFISSHAIPPLPSFPPIPFPPPLPCTGANDHPPPQSSTFLEWDALVAFLEEWTRFLMKHKEVGTSST